MCSRPIWPAPPASRLVSPHDVARHLPFHPASGLPSAAALLQLLAFGWKLMLPLALLNLLVTGGIVLATT
jgi:hypothetical protein